MANRWDNHKLTKELALEILENHSTAIDGHRLIDEPDNTGYGRIALVRRKYLAHRVAAWIYWNLDLKDTRTKVLHKCQYKNCWAYDCLYIGNQSENLRDAYRIGTRNRMLLTTIVNKENRRG